MKEDDTLPLPPPPPPANRPPPAAAADTDETAVLSVEALVGQTIDHYRIIRLLGQGGTGAVYLARDLKLEREVALKMVGAGTARSVTHEALKRFLREARALASLDHPHIVQVHTVGETPEHCYIVMQYIRGQTLTAKLEEQGPLSVADALAITRQVAEALAAIHELGLVHRDVKPSNIMLEDSGRVKVMDFGLARTADHSTAVTREGLYVGTPKYSSPEQCETTTIDRRSDLYSLGVILYEMLSGQTPHDADTPLALMRKIVGEEPRPLAELNPDLPAAVLEIVNRLLARSPEARYESASALITALDTVAASPDGRALAAPRPARRLGWYVAAGSAAVVLFLLLALGLWALMSAPSNPPTPNTTVNPVLPPTPTKSRVRLAVYDFQNLTHNPELNWLEIGLPDLLAANLTQDPAFTVCTRDQILWAEDASQAPDEPRPTRVDDALRDHLLRLGVELVIKGSVYQNAEQLRFIVRSYRLSQGELLVTIEKNGVTSRVFATVDELGSELTANLRTRLAPTDVKRVTALGEANPVRSTCDAVRRQFHLVLSDLRESAGADRKRSLDYAWLRETPEEKARKDQNLGKTATAAKAKGGRGGVAGELADAEAARQEGESAADELRQKAGAAGTAAAAGAADAPGRGVAEAGKGDLTAAAPAKPVVAPAPAPSAPAARPAEIATQVAAAGPEAKKSEAAAKEIEEADKVAGAVARATSSQSLLGGAKDAAAALPQDLSPEQLQRLLPYYYAALSQLPAHCHTEAEVSGLRQALVCALVAAADEAGLKQAVSDWQKRLPAAPKP